MTVLKKLANIYHIIFSKTKILVLYHYFINIFIFNYFLKKQSNILIRWKKILRSSDYKFTMNNITQSVHLFENLKKDFKKRNINAIIIGCFGGMSTIFLLKNFNIKKFIV